MDQEKSLSFTEYDHLCHEACKGFVPSGNKEADEELLLRRICKNVFAYLKLEYFVAPVAGGTNLNAYRLTLQHLVSKRQSESFDTLETPGKYIRSALSNSYGQP
jgi:hypothetical protein